MNVFIGYVVGIIVGALIAILWMRARSVFGVLRIDHSDSEKDLYRLEIDDLDGIVKRKFVFLKIDHKADLHSQ